MSTVRRTLGRLAVPLVALATALAIGAVLMLARGANPVKAYAALFNGAFGDLDSVLTTIERATPLVLTGLAVCLGYRGGVFNIGAEGQLVLGGMAATAVGLRWAGLPPVVHAGLALAAGALAGALWSLLPGLLRARRGVNEVITTLMLNTVAVQLLAWAVRVDVGAGGALGWLGLKDPTQPFPRSASIAAGARLPELLSEYPVSVAAVVALGATLIVWFVLARTTFGFALVVVGANPHAARVAGIPVERTLLGTMLASGALAGLAGALEITGSQHRIIDDFLSGGGYDGIAVALVGLLHPVGVVAAALFFGGLRAGANTMQIATGVPVSLVAMLKCLAIVALLSARVIQDRRRDA